MTGVMITNINIIFLVDMIYSFNQQSTYYFTEHLLLCASSMLGAGYDELRRSDMIPGLMEISSSYNIL